MYVSVFLSRGNTKGGGSVRRKKREMPVADMVVIGKIFTANQSALWQEAFAVKSGMIIAMGSQEKIVPYIGEYTAIINEKSGIILPGMEEYQCTQIMSQLMQYKEQEKLKEESSASKITEILLGGQRDCTYSTGHSVIEVGASADFIITNKNPYKRNKLLHSSIVAKQLYLRGSLIRDLSAGFGYI